MPLKARACPARLMRSRTTIFAIFKTMDTILISNYYLINNVCLHTLGKVVTTRALGFNLPMPFLFKILKKFHKTLDRAARMCYYLLI